MNNNTNNSILNNECAICYNYLFKRNTVFTLCCKQKIHKKCLDECYGINNRCPFCRTNNQNNNNIFINQNHHNLNIILINPYYIDYILLVIFSCLTITYLILRIIFSVIDIILLLLNEENLIII
jgi:hypothetical protein